jgi:hypothetical protein
MRSALQNLTILILSSLLLAACSDAGTTQVAEGHSPPASQPGTGAAGIQGKVLHTMDSGGYTYVRIQADGKEIWAAGPKIAVQIGDEITAIDAMEMKNFHSKTLDRTFESLWFAGKLVKAGEATSMAGDGVGAAHAGASSHGATAVRLMVEAGSVPKAKDGYCVAELFAKRKDLSMRQVSVRGKVVKFNPGIMGKNWLHVQDGTGAPGANDLTVTCDTAAKVGDIVLIRGSLVLDKDFGAGYKYDVMIEDAQITVED